MLGARNRAKPGQRLLGPTVDYVLRNAHLPGDGRRPAGGRLMLQANRVLAYVFLALGVAIAVRTALAGGGQVGLPGRRRLPAAGLAAAAREARLTRGHVRGRPCDATRMARRIPVLGRVLGAPALYASVYGEIGSSLYYALGITAVYALRLTPVVFLIAGCAVRAGGRCVRRGRGDDRRARAAEPRYARRAFNDMAGFVAGWATVLDYLISSRWRRCSSPITWRRVRQARRRLAPGRRRALAMAIVLAITAVRLVRRTRRVHRRRRRLAARPGRPGRHGGVRPGAPVRLARPDRTTSTSAYKPTWSALAFALPIAMIGIHRPGEGCRPGRDGEEPGEAHGARQRSAPPCSPWCSCTRRWRPQRPRHIRSNADPAAPAGYSSELTTTWLDAPLLGLQPAVGIASPSRSAIAAAAGRRPDGDADPGAGHHHQLLGLCAAGRRDGRSDRSCRRCSAVRGRRARAAHLVALVGRRRAGDGLPAGGRGLRARGGGADAGLALQLRHPDRPDAGQRIDRLAADGPSRTCRGRSRCAATSPMPAASDPGAGRARCVRRVRRVGGRPGHPPGRPGGRPMLDDRRAADVRGRAGAARACR